MMGAAAMQLTTNSEAAFRPVVDTAPTGPRPEDFSQILLGGKIPIEKGWQRFCEEKRVLTSEQRRGRQIGYTCGPASRLLVLDVDDHEKFRACCRANGWQVPATFTVETGSGGVHHYFRYPLDGTHYGNKSLPAWGFDTRGHGGQVVAPGSIHPETGKPYRVVNDIPLAEPPAWLLNLYAKPAAQPTGERHPVSNYGAAALAAELAALAGTAPGGRNAQLNRSAFVLGQLVGGGVLEQGQVETALTAAAAGIGLSAAEAKATIESGLSGGMAQPRKAPEKAMQGEAARPVESVSLEDWPDPVSLCPTERPTPYPIDALPKIISEAVAEVTAFVQCPEALTACCALAAISTVGAGIVDVRRANKLTGPTGLYFLAIADSGERKTTVDGFFTKAIHQWEAEQEETMAPLMTEYKAAVDAWAAERDGLILAIKDAAKRGH